MLFRNIIDIFRLTVNRKFLSKVKYLWVIEMILTLGEKVRNLREDADLNQTQLGKAVNMTQRKISYIECGKYEPSIEDIVAFCKYFNVSADYLLGLKESKR